MQAARKPECLIEFEQQIQPKGVPKALKGLTRRIAAQSLSDTLHDIDCEARRIRRGKPRLAELAKYQSALSPASATLARLQAPLPFASITHAAAQRHSGGAAATGGCHLERGPRLALAAVTAAHRRPARVGGEQFGWERATDALLRRVPCSQQSCAGLWCASLGNVTRL